MSVVVADEKLAFRRLFLLAPPMLFQLPALLLATYFAIYATDVLLVAPAVVGTIVMVARIFDAVTDPLIGMWSDRRGSPRRQPLILYGALLFPALIGLWLVPRGLDGFALAAWLLGFYLLFELGQTLRSVSISALALEVASTSKKRVLTQVVFRTFGMAAYIISLAVMQHLTDHDDPRSALVPIVLASTALLTISYLLAARYLKELPRPHRTEERSYATMLKEVLANRYHRHFILIQMAEGFAFACIGFAVPYVMRYVLDAPELTTWVFLATAITTVVASFAWWRIVPRLGTRRTWLVGQCFWLAVLVCWPLVPYLGVPFFLLLAVVAGIGNGAGKCVGFAMLGDIADYDARESGRQRQGIYVTVYGLVNKIMLALAAFGLGWGMQLAGYVPNEEQGTGFLVAMTLMISVVPGIAMLGSIRLLHRYTLYEDHDIPDGREPRESLTLQTA